VWRRGSREKLWARGALDTWSSGPSTSPLGVSLSARFEVREVFRISARRKVVVAGVILDGTVRSGQIINFKLQDGLFCSAKIASVEYIDRVSSRESLVGLLCDEQDPQEAALYAELCPPGTVVEVNDAAAA